MAVITSANNSALSPLNVFYDKIPLKRLIAKTVFYQLAWKKSLEDNMGRTYSWTVGGVQAADTTVLSEGAPVVPTNATSNTVTAQLQEYGNALAVSSLLGNTSVVDADKFLLEQVEQKGAYTIDQLIRNEVFNTCTTFNTNLFAANNKTSIAAIGAADTLSNSDVRRLHGLLEQNNVPSYNNTGKMAMVVTIGQKYDVTNSNAGGGFLDLAKQNPKGIEDIKKAMRITEDGEVEPLGEYAGMVLYATSLSPVVSNGTVNVHYAAAWGDQSLAAAELSGERFKIFRKEADKGTYDILEMIKLAMGYKVAFAAKNLSQDLTTAANQRVLVMGSANSLF